MNPILSGVLEPPSSFGADIVVGEGQPLGNAMSLRRPRPRLLRLPAGAPAPDARPHRRPHGRRRRQGGVRAHDADARAAHPPREGDEQHLHQPRAQRARCRGVPVRGRAEGLAGVGRACVAKAHYLRDALLATGKFDAPYSAPFANEFALRYKADPADARGDARARLPRRRRLGAIDPGMDGLVLFAGDREAHPRRDGRVRGGGGVAVTAEDARFPKERSRPRPARPDLRDRLARVALRRGPAARRAGGLRRRRAGRMRPRAGARAAARDRGRDRAALPPPRLDELRRRLGLVPARILHHEVQPEGERGRLPSRGLRRPAPVPAARDHPGRSGADGRPRRRARRDHRSAGRLPAAGRRRARRVHGAHDVPRLPHRDGRPRASASSSPTPRTARTPRAWRWRATRSPRSPATRTARSIWTRSKAALDTDVAAFMLTNPNTLGLFDENIVAITEAVHAVGALAYCDGANLNAIMGKARPGDMGFDAMHINLHKTFTTPHGGGGPGAGPVVRDRGARALPARPAARASRRRDLRPRLDRPVDRPRPRSSSATSACWCARTPTSSPWEARASPRSPSRRFSRRTT